MPKLISLQKLSYNILVLYADVNKVKNPISGKTQLKAIGM